MPITEQAARRALEALLADFEKLTDEQRKAMSEASVVRQFVDRLLEEVLGWPIKDPARYKYEMHTQAGRPDLTLFPERGGTIFIEAKRFGIIKQLEQARYTIAGTITPGQMALPGMSVDRTPEEQQAINYAFANGGTWAILTNFEKLRLFNARRDWLVLSFEEPSAYLRDFDLFWQLAYHNVVNGSLDALSNQRHTEEVDTQYLNFINEWRERLARDIIQHRDVNAWAFLSDGGVNLPLLRFVVQRFLDRLVIIRFAEDHLVIPPGTLHQFYDLRNTNPYSMPMDTFIDHFFRQFDEKHNSALFALSVVDEAAFSDDVLMPLIAKLYEARYRAMLADILGNTYEQYLGKALVLDNGSVTTRDNLETRKKQGSYYTPQVIVRYIVDNSLGRYLYGTENGKQDGQPIPGETRKTAADIRDLRVLDSACGSGSFLIYAYYVLADFYESETERLEREGEVRRRELAAEGVTSPLELQIQLTPYSTEIERISDYPRLILETHLYGVDLDPQAAEIAVVNLMMRAMERRHREKRLPLILNQNVKVGNGLVGLRPDDSRLDTHREVLAAIRQLRADLVKTPNGSDHDRIIRELETATTGLNALLDVDFTAHFSNLERVRPFHWGVEFPEVFYNADGTLKDNPGFMVVFGNPPWEILKPDLREFYAQFDERIESRFSRAQVEQRVEELNTEDPRRQVLFVEQTRNTEQVTTYIRQSSDYKYQGQGHIATHKAFVERMYQLLRVDGRLGYIIPSGIYTDQGTQDLRHMLFDTGTVEYLYGLANIRGFFREVDSRFKFTLIGVKKSGKTKEFRTMFLLSHAAWPQVTDGKDSNAVLAGVLYDNSRVYQMPFDLVKRFSPDSLSLMEFQSQTEIDIATKIYDSHPLLGEEVEGSWNVRFSREFDMTDDRDIFKTQNQGLPLYEGKMIWFYDAYFAEPQYWIDELVGVSRLTNEESRRTDYLSTRLAFRRIASNTNERTLISAILPAKAFSGNSLFNEVGRALDSNTRLFLMALMNSLTLDYVLRQKMTANVNLFYVLQLPFPRLNSGNPYFDAIVPRAAQLTCTRAEFADLWQEVMGEVWDESKGATDPAERQRLRDEVDALVAHLYGLARDEFNHILGTFPLVFPDTPEGQAKRERLLKTFDEKSVLSAF